MGFDIQVVGQAILYFMIFILSFVVAIPLGITVAQFHQECTLYTEFTSLTSANFSKISTCNYPIYVPVVLMLYAVGVGVYHMYTACRSKDSTIGFQMWVLPFVFFNAIAALMMLIASCIISVGLKTSCDSFLNMYKGIEDCADVERLPWVRPPVDAGHHYYYYPKTSEIAGWVTFLLWVAQLLLSVLRFFRNNRSRQNLSAALPPAAVPAPASKA